MSDAPQFAAYPSLRDQLVLITGGATGIGASIVEHFALQGSQVAFLDVDQKNAEHIDHRDAPFSLETNAIKP